MDYILCSNSLHDEADKILFSDGLHEIINKYGEINYTGSYLYNLMACSDIDISLVMSESKFSVDKFFQMGNEIAKLDGTKDMRLQNFFKISIEGLPEGFYWGIKYKSNFSDRIWNIDLWVVDNSITHQHKIYANKLLKLLDDEKRRIIINTKYSLLDKEGKTPVNSGYYIYEAVLFKGISEQMEIINYLKMKNVKVWY